MDYKLGKYYTYKNNIYEVINIYRYTEENKEEIIIGYKWHGLRSRFYNGLHRLKPTFWRLYVEKYGLKTLILGKPHGSFGIGSIMDNESVAI